MTDAATDMAANVPHWVDFNVGASLDGFADVAGEYLVRIVRTGVRAALGIHLTEPIALT